MIRKLLPRLILWTSLLALAIGGGCFVYDAVITDAQLLATVEKDVQADFLREIRDAAESAKLNQRKLVALNYTSERNVVLEYTQNGALLNWSSQQFVPQPLTVKKQLLTFENELLVDRDLVYYNIKTQTDSSVLFYLIPLKIVYPIKNEYLSDYLYLGRYTERQPVNDELSNFQFVLFTPTKYGVNIRDAGNNFVYGIQITDVSPFRWQTRMLAVAFLGAGLAGLTFAIGLVARRTKKLLNEILFLAGLVILRTLLLVLNLPRVYLDTELFSSRLLAINEVYPSLGDLTLNTLILILIVHRFFVKTNHKELTDRLQRISPHLWIPAAAFTAGLGLFLYLTFFNFFDLIFINSKIYYEFADIFKLNFYTYLVFSNLAALLFAFFLITYFCMNQAVTLAVRAKTPPYAAPAVFLIVFLISLVGTADYGFRMLGVFILYFSLIFIVRLRNEYLQINLVNVLGILLGFVAINFTAIIVSHENNMASDMQRYAQKHAYQRDLITEYVFDEVIENLRLDKTLWQADTTFDGPRRISEELTSEIINKHLINSFKGYDFQVFVYNSLGRRLDNQFELTPYILTLQARQLGKTLSENFFLVPYNRSVSRQIYVGWFPVSPSLRLQVELHPKAITGGKLYPQLLLDEKVRSRLHLPAGYEMAIYRNNQLVQKVENTLGQDDDFSFPITINIPLPTDGSKQLFREAEAYAEYIDFQPEGRTVIIRAPRRSLLTNLTTISLLFYFYLLIGFLYLAPNLARRFSSAYWSNLRYSFVFRIQFFLVFLSLTPMVLFWFLTSSMFTRFFYKDAYNNLNGTLEQVSDYLENEPSYLEELKVYNLAPSPSARDLLNRISNLLACDINVYNLKGYMHSTTKSKLYHASLSSYYMNPVTYRNLLHGNQSEIIARERIGNLSYFSGYKPLFDANLNLIGFLNIPFLAQQDLLDNQIEKFITYLVNVYVFLILILVSIGFFISRTITYPLEILRQKLDQTRFGLQANEPIVWKSKDEIGSLIVSYNQMLEKLADSEKKLAKNERELAWREMARQVAHEIKNPLTPMRLSIQHLIRAMKTNGDRVQEMVEKIAATLLTQIDSLTSIANSFSQFAQMPNDVKERVNISEILREVYELYANAEEAELALNGAESDAFIMGDKNKLSRVFVNLIRNAMQAMPDRGKIALQLAISNGKATVSVADDGSGIPKEIQSRIFEPNFSTKTSGMGLGLAITRRIVESMDGEIQFESAEGVGTTFYLTFPLTD